MARDLAVGIAGLGTIGGALARLIASGGIPGQRLAAVGVCAAPERWPRYWEHRLPTWW